MEFHQLRYFVAVAEDGSFSRAAERMRVAQPSLSQQIQKLEAEIGQPLFDRLPRSVTPTAAGQRLLVRARKILTDLADARRCVDDEGESAVSALCVGIIPTIAPYLLRPVLRALREEYPAAQVEIIEDVSDNLLRAIDDGEIDMAVLSTCRNGASANRKLLAREPLVAVLPETHPLAARKVLSADDLAEECFVMLHETHCLSKQIVRWCAQHGFRPRVTLSAVQVSTLVAMIAAEQGISMLPAMAVPHERGHGCAFVPFKDSPPEREINLLRNPARYWSRAAEGFTNIVSRTVAESIAGTSISAPAPRRSAPLVAVLEA